MCFEWVVIRGATEVVSLKSKTNPSRPRIRRISSIPLVNLSPVVESRYCVGMGLEDSKGKVVSDRCSPFSSQLPPDCSFLFLMELYTFPATPNNPPLFSVLSSRGNFSWDSARRSCVYTSIKLASTTTPSMLQVDPLHLSFREKILGFGALQIPRVARSCSRPVPIQLQQSPHPRGTTRVSAVSPSFPSGGIPSAVSGVPRTNRVNPAHPSLHSSF